MWPKIIDEMIAGLPTNSAQRLELEKLRLKSANDDARIKELEAKLAALQPAHGVEADAAKILKAFFDHGDVLTAEQIAERFGMKVNVVQYHFDKLAARKFLRCATIYGGYDIEPAGREFIVQNGMA